MDCFIPITSHVGFCPLSKKQKELFMKLSPHYLKRYKDIALLLLKYGNTGMVSNFGLDEALTEEERGAQAGMPAEEELPNDLEALGPTFVKLGQLLSSRPDLLPERYLKALSR